MNNYTWICCQLGAREHYAIPRVLHQKGQLKTLVTDTWIDRSHPLNWLPKSYLSSLRARYHPQLETATVKSFGDRQIAWEIIHRSKLQAWSLMMARNLWWQKQVLSILDRESADNITLFAYSYAALELFKYAKQRGWKTILGQIDPGIIESQLVSKIALKYPALAATNTSPQDYYWSNWQAECNLADRIIVNSSWTSHALQQVGIESTKIVTVPLAYEREHSHDFVRTYPDRFTPQRPLKVLFLGQVIIRKGVAEICEAIALLTKSSQPVPVEFWFVGELKIMLSPELKHHPQVKWLGSVPRSQTCTYYQQADIFLLPTHSDGFALTQLEAQSWQLPIVASKFCGSVVKDRINGLTLPQITAKEIVKSIAFCLHNPQELTKFSQNSTQILSEFSFSNLAHKITNININ